MTDFLVIAQADGPFTAMAAKQVHHTELAKAVRVALDRAGVPYTSLGFDELIHHLLGMAVGDVWLDEADDPLVCVVCTSGSIAQGRAV